MLKTTIILTFPTPEKQTVLGGGYIENQTAKKDIYKVPNNFFDLFMSSLRVSWRKNLLTCTQVHVLKSNGSQYTLEITTNRNIVRLDKIEPVEALRGVGS